MFLVRDLAVCGAYRTTQPVRWPATTTSEALLEAFVMLASVWSLTGCNGAELKRWSHDGGQTTAHRRVKRHHWVSPTRSYTVGLMVTLL